MPPPGRLFWMEPVGAYEVWEVVLVYETAKALLFFAFAPMAIW